MALTARVTGPGITERVNCVSADLGIVRYDPKRKAYAYCFGDNFSDRYMKGEWQSPSILMYDADHQLLGIPAGSNQIVSSGNRRQAIPYQHNENGISTILPCDLILIDDVWTMAVMVVGMGGLGDEQRTTFWQSHDLVEWFKTDPYVHLDHKDENGRPIGHMGNTMLTFDRIGDWVYIYGTGGLARNRGIWLWRCASSTFPHGLWVPWGMDNDGTWYWGNPNEATPFLPGRYGELSFRSIQGQSALSFFDAQRYCCSAITAPSPTTLHADVDRVDYAHGRDYAQLYGGYITDDSRLNEPGGMKFLVSQWDTISGDNSPYHVVAFADTLNAVGPLVEPEPEPEPPPKPEPPSGGSVMSPQQLYELLLRELSASGSIPIVTPEGDNITLREAVEQIFYKERGLHGLEGRPRHPGEKDDQLGQVLSARAEGLFTQAVVVAIADRFDIDTAAIYKAVQKSIGS